MSSQLFDEEMLDKSIGVFHPDISHKLVEIRIPKATSDQKVYSGIFDNAADIINELKDFCERYSYSGGIYMTMNSLKREPTNRLERSYSTVKDSDIDTIDWILIDVDPKRKSGVSSTDKEKRKARDLICKINDDLQSDHGISGVMSDSGNGFHLLLPAEFPNESSAVGGIKEFLSLLDKKYSTDSVSVDTTVSNPSRITKLYGTMASKGENTSDRPHRMSKIVDLPKRLQAISLDQLQGVIKKMNLPVHTIDLSGQNSHSKPSLEYTRALLRALPSNFDNGNDGYETWLKVISAVRSEFSASDTIMLIEEWSPGQPGEVEMKLKHPSQNVSIGFGWLVNLAKEYGLDVKRAWEESYRKETLYEPVAEELMKPKSRKQLVQRSQLRLHDKLLKSLPHVVQEYIKVADEKTDAPKEFLLSPFLTISAALLGSKRYVVTSPGKIYPVIWTVLFGQSSSFRKSTSINLAKEVFNTVDDKFENQYLLDLRDWEDEVEHLKEKDPDAWLPEEPVRNEIYLSCAFSDATFWEEMHNQNGLVSTPGEFTQLWDEINRPHNAMGDFMLDLFDAPDRIKRNTKNSGIHILQTPIWNIISGTTLDSFRNKLTHTHRGSGMLQRVLPVCVLENPKKYKDLLYSNPHLQEHGELIKDTVLKLAEIRLNGSQQELAIGDDAKRQYQSWAQRFHDEAMLIEKSIQDYPGYASRLEAYALKFALLFQILDDPNSSEISAQNMLAATNLIDWHSRHTIYMLENNYIFDKIYADRLKIRELLQKSRDNKLSRTKLMQNSNFEKTRLDKALDSEIESGNIIKMKTDANGKKPRISYKLVKGDSES